MGGAERKRDGMNIEVKCDRIGGCLKKLFGPETSCKCDHRRKVVNEQLAVAAPLLYDAVVNLLDCLADDPRHRAAIAEARAAISRADGVE